MAFAERILSAVREPLSIEDNELFIGASVGIALFPDDGRSSAELMANADLAMYRAKATAGSKACFFESGMDLQVRERRSLARDLRQALAQEEFELYYQPQSRLTDNRTIGYEALIRCEAYLALGDRGEASLWLERAYAVMEAHGTQYNRFQVEALAQRF